MEHQLRRSTARRTAAALLLALTVSGCTTGSQEDKAAEGPPKVKSDIGVTDSDITLGVLADQSGPAASQSMATNRGLELWVAQANNDGGICGRDVALQVADTVSDPATATTAYQSQQPAVLGLAHISGAASTAALAPQIAIDDLLAIADSPSSGFLGEANIVTLGPTYDIQAINGLAWLAESGLIDEGAVIGHLRNNGEYGLNAALGVQAYAAENGLQVIDAPVGAAEVDMTAAMTTLQQQGVAAVVVSVSPAATMSAAVANKKIALDVPLLTGSDSYDPALLEGVTVTAAATQLNVVQGFAPLSANVPAAQDLFDAYSQKYGDVPGPHVVSGYVAGLTWGKVLEAACEAKDLTRAGVLAARDGLKELDTGALSVSIDLGDPAAPSSRESLIVRTSTQYDGKLVLAEAPFVAAEADSYQVP